MTLPLLVATVSLAAIITIWAGYPIGIWVLAQFTKPRAKGDAQRAAARTVSVIVATRDRADLIRARVANLLDTQHPAERTEIVVVLDHDDAQCTASELAGCGERVRVIVGDAPGGKAASLNAGVRHATGEILVLADAAQRFEASTIPELVMSLEDQRFGAVSGALDLGRANNRRSPVDWYWSLEKWLRFNEARVHSTVGVTGAVYATRRVLWPTVPPGTLLDDVFVPMSLVMAGHRIGFTYAARATDVRTFDSKNEGARKTRTLTGVLQLLKIVPGILSPTRNPIAVQFVAHKLLRLLTPLFAIVFAIALMAAFIQFVLRATPLQLAIGGAGVLVVLLLPQTRRPIVGLMRWVVSLQMATARAVSNAIGGRWGVWTKAKH